MSSALKISNDGATRTPDRGRQLAVGLSLGFVILVLIGQLFRYQIVEHASLKQAAIQQRSWEKTMPVPRGVIVDANDRVLATDLLVWDVEVSPWVVDNDLDTLAAQLSWLLAVPVAEVRDTLSSDVPWAQLAGLVPAETGRAIQKLGATGVEAVPRVMRTYPEGALLAHVLGVVTLSGDGYHGVEGYYDAQLKGTAGVRLVQQYPTGDEIPGTSNVITQPSIGTSLVLTLDTNIQRKVDRELEHALTMTGASGGTVLVLDPRTGAILASVSRPNYNPNDLTNANPSLIPDPAVSLIWEPGSVFDIITWAAGVDSAAISPETLFTDTGSMEVGGRVIQNWDRRGHGRVSMSDALANSLNTAAAHISTTMGKDTYYAYLQRFGFGELSEVDLGAEGSGFLRLPGDANWFPSDLGFNAFGQGLAVTPMQLATAVSAVANGGLLVKPHIVKQLMMEEDGKVELTEVETTVIRRVLSEETASAMTSMLVYAADVNDQEVPGYTIAGKSGTAQVPTEFGYDPVETMTSYVGFAPVDDPEFIILVKLDRPKSSPWGSRSAWPLFQSIAEWMFQYRGIAPELSQ